MNLMELMMNLGCAHGELCIATRNSRMNQGRHRPYRLDLAIIREEAVKVAVAAGAIIRAVEKMEKKHPFTSPLGKVI